MGVRRPRVGGGVTPDEVRQPWARRRPEAERAVDVDPGSVRVGDRDDRLEVVERAGVHLAGLRADDQRLPGAGEDAFEELGAHPALVVDRHDELLGPTDPEQPQRAGQRHVALLADDDPERRRAGETLLAEVVADPLVHGLTGGGERGDVRHLAAGHERERGVRRQPEQLEHPAARHRLERRDGGRRLREPGVLIPGRDEPVRRERRGERAADHEAEVPARAHRRQPGLGNGRELVDEGERIRCPPPARGRRRP